LQIKKAVFIMLVVIAVWGLGQGRDRAIFSVNTSLISKFAWCLCIRVTVTVVVRLGLE